MHPMLTDFGIARLADSPGLTRTHEFVGTPAYVAPESAEGRPQTSAVDIYGAGILLYELVTGRPPFGGGSALEVLHQHLSAEPRRPSTVPDPLWTVIERCLRKNPDERPSAENLARGLRTVAAGIGVHANSAQITAAEGVGALLAPDLSPGDRPRHARRRRPHPGAAAGRGLVRPERRDQLPAAHRRRRPHLRTARTVARPTRPPSCRPCRRTSRAGRAAPRTRTPGRTSCARPATATSRRRSSTSTRTRTRCAAARSGRSHGPSSARSSSSPPQGQQPPPGYGYPQQQQPQQYAPQQPQRSTAATRPAASAAAPAAAAVRARAAAASAARAA